MSVSNLLNPETLNQEWSVIYCNELHANNIVSPDTGSIGTTQTGGTTTTPQSPAFGDPDTTAEFESPSTDYFIPQPRSIQVLKQGYYHVNLKASAEFAFNSGILSMGIKIDGNSPITIPNSLVSSIYVPQQNAITSFNLAGIVPIGAGETISFGFSRSSGTTNTIWHNWELVISVIDIL
jgi:hypothetical protein